MKQVFLLFLLGWMGTSGMPQLVGQSRPAPNEVEKNFAGLAFRSLGPTRGGRVTAVAGHQAHPGSFYLGATGGGVWKTTDYGQRWFNVSDGFLASPSIGAIQVAPSQPEVVYVGTGSDGLRSNVIAGKGVYRSNNGGKTWQHLGLERTGHIGAILVHPRQPEVALVAAIGQAFGPNPERGVFRTTNGGQSWDKVLFLNDSVGFADLEFHPANPQVVYAAAWQALRQPWTIVSGGKTGGIYKSTDGGITWRKVTQGLPPGLIGKIDFAVSPAAPNRVYALVEAPQGQGGVYRSEDSGETWQLQSTKPELLDRPFYYCNIDANPLNADAIYVSATQFWYSGNGGKNWIPKPTPHGDNHDLWINPSDSLLMIQSNDGGANISRDGGQTWSSIDNQPTAELYQVAVDNQFPYWVYAGQQDNSTIALPVLPPYDAPAGFNSFWMAVGGCETGPAIPSPLNHNVVYSNCKGCFGTYDKRTGQERLYFVGASNIYGHQPTELKYRFQRVAPIAVSPHDPRVVYHGSQYVHRTIDDGVTWTVISPDLTANDPSKQVISGSPITRDVTGEEYYSTLYEIAESPRRAGVIWTGANDGPIHVTTNNGKTWQNVTPAGLPPGGRVDCIEPSPHEPGKAYAAILRYQLDDWRPYIYKTTNFGASWTLLSDGKNGIPANVPVRVVREDPQRPGLLWAGTEEGLYVSFDDGQHWSRFQRNLPLTPITDLRIHQGDLVLSTMGRGFWILDNLSPLRQFNPTIAQSPVHLFKPADQYRLRYNGNAANETPHYPQPQVLVDYYLRDSVREAITLEILNEQQQVIRTFTSDRRPLDTARGAETRNMATNFFNSGFSAALGKTPGLHRFAWDIRHWGPWDKTGFRSSRGAPLAAPGRYQVRLRIGATSLTQSFQLLMDPRLAVVKITDQDLKEQETLALAVVELESKIKQLAEPVKTALAANPADPVLKAINDALQMAPGRYMMPQLLSQVAYLRGMLHQADQKPGRDAQERYRELQQAYQHWHSQWQSWEQKNPSEPKTEE